MRMTRLAFLPLLAAACLAGPAALGPAALRAEEPEKAASKEGAGRWTLHLEHGPLNTVRWTDGSGKTVAYHYMTLKATNKTAFARDWRPEVRAVVDTKPNAPSYALPYPEALDAIRKQERNPTLPMLSETGTKIEPGETKSAVAIFGRLDPAYDRVHVELRGFVNPVAVYKVEKYSNNRVIYVDAAYYDRNQLVRESLRKEAKETADGRLPSPEVEYQAVMEDRVFDIEYMRQGDEYQAEDSTIRFVKEGWRVEGDPKFLRTIHPAPKAETK
jgi:hypothetical protein